MTLRSCLSMLAVVAALTSPAAAHAAQLPKGVPPLHAEAAMHEIPGESSDSGWSLFLTMQSDTWKAIQDELPDLKWPKVTQIVTDATIYEGTMALPVTDGSSPPFFRVVDRNGKQLGRKELLKQLSSKKRVLVSVNGRMPEPCYLNLPPATDLIVLLGPSDERSSASATNENANSATAKKAPKRPGGTWDSPAEVKEFGDAISQVYYFSLLNKAKSYKLETEEKAAKYLQGIWRLDKAAHFGGGHYVRAGRGDDVTVICTDGWLVQTDFNVRKKSLRETVDRLKKVSIGPKGVLEADSIHRKFMPIDDDHMAVMAYDYIAVVKRAESEPKTQAKDRAIRAEPGGSPVEPKESKIRRRE